MRLKESNVYKNRLVNDKNRQYIGKCVNDNNNYWYRDINYNLIKKYTCIEINKYWL